MRHPEKHREKRVKIDKKLRNIETTEFFVQRSSVIHRIGGLEVRKAGTSRYPSCYPSYRWF